MDLATEIGIQRRRARSLKGVHHRPGSRNEFSLSELPSRNWGLVGSDQVDGGQISRRLSLEANQIVEKFLEDEILMLNDKDRIEGLRRMPEGLSLKKKVRSQLCSSVKNRKSGRISYWKKSKYSTSVAVSQMIEWIKNVKYRFELWYSWLKKIEGQFGSGVATYFKFLRWMFLINIIVFIISLGFVVSPQLILESSRLNNSIVSPARIRMMDANFRLGNIFTGEGYLTSSVLYYGFYSNETLSFNGIKYNMPSAYFFSALVSYFFVFISLSISMAVSYKKSFIENAGSVNIFANKVLGGWDFGITTREAAILKHKSIYIELKELMEEELIKVKKKPWLTKAFNLGQQISINVLLLLIAAVAGFYSWKFLEKAEIRDIQTTMMTSLVVTLIIHLAPIFLTWILRFEDYDSPRTAVYVTLVRTFVLNILVIGLIIAQRLTDTSKDKHQCWETGLGQEIYRMILLDTLIGLLMTSLAQFVRYRIAVSFWPGIGYPEFDIARNTMNLIYNLTLFYAGLYFSPLLSVVILIKLLLTFYIKAFGALYNCKPSERMWRAAQAHTIFLVFAFMAFCLVLGLYGYILSSVRTSECGTFRGNKLMYEDVLESISNVDTHSSIIVTILLYVRKPGMVAIILLAMCLVVYYLRAVGHARTRVLNMLQDILKLQADDKNYLLRYLSKITKHGPSASIDKQLPRRLSSYKSQPNLSDLNKSNYEGLHSSRSMMNVASTSRMEAPAKETFETPNESKKLNFNPIFTPSFVDKDYDNDAEIPEIVMYGSNGNLESHRSPYIPFDYDERIPSRIAFRGNRTRRPRLEM